jgi:hypothetical protein
LIATEWQYVFESIAAGGSVMTAVALCFVWGQFRQVQQEHEHTFRPFLYLKRINITEDCSVELILGNTGRLPAKIIELKGAKKGSPITQEELRSSKGRTENLPTIMPEEREKISLLGSTILVHCLSILMEIIRKENLELQPHRIAKEMNSLF